MAINRVAVTDKASYDQAFIDQEALGFYLKRDKTVNFVGELIFTDIQKSLKNSGRTFQNANDAIDFLLAPYGLSL